MCSTNLGFYKESRFLLTHTTKFLSDNMFSIPFECVVLDKRIGYERDKEMLISKGAVKCMKWYVVLRH